MAKTVKLFWIKERRNPQLGTYWVPMGQMSKSSAKKHEAPLYGKNVMHSFTTETEYKDKIQQLKAENARVQGE